MMEFVSGIIVAGYAVAGAFFLKFWRQTHDRLFLIFALAFATLGAQRIALAFSSWEGERQVQIYSVRLLAFLLILGAIIDKNRRSS